MFSVTIPRTAVGPDVAGPDRPCQSRRPAVDSDNDNYGMSDASAGSLRLETCEFHHLGPLVSFLCDELAEVGGRTRVHCGTQLGGPGLDLGIGKGSVDLAIELVDDWGGRAPWCSNRS